MPEIQKPRRGRPRKWRGPLAKYMIETGTRAEDLADELAVDLSSVYRWFRGVAFPSLSKAKAIQEVARRSGRTLSLEDILNPGPINHDEEKHAKGKVIPTPRVHTRGARLQA